MVCLRYDLMTKTKSVGQGPGEQCLRDLYTVTKQQALQSIAVLSRAWAVPQGAKDGLKGTIS